MNPPSSAANIISPNLPIRQCSGKEAKRFIDINNGHVCVFQKGDHTSLKRPKGNKMPMKHSSSFTSHSLYVYVLSSNVTPQPIGKNVG